MQCAVHAIRPTSVSPPCPPSSLLKQSSHSQSCESCGMGIILSRSAASAASLARADACSTARVFDSGMAFALGTSIGYWTTYSALGTSTTSAPCITPPASERGLQSPSESLRTRACMRVMHSWYATFAHPSLIGHRTTYSEPGRSAGPSNSNSASASPRSRSIGVCSPIASDAPVASRGPKAPGTQNTGTPVCGTAACTVALVPGTFEFPTATMFGDVPAKGVCMTPGTILASVSQNEGPSKNARSASLF